MDNIYKAVQLTIDSPNLALSKKPTHVYIANQYVDTNDTPLITAPFIIQKALENGTGVVDIVSSTIGSIYEVRLLCDAEVLISGYFYMPPMNVNFSELELYTSYPPRTPPVINEFWQQTEQYILEKTNTLLNFVQVFNAVASIRLSLGSLDELLTTKNGSAIAAINELKMNVDNIVNLIGGSELKTSDKTSLKNAINEILLIANQHISNQKNPHKVTKAQVGLGEVDNTSDVDKPLSNAVTNALIGKSDKTDTYTKNETDNRIAALASTTFAGHKGYATLADAQAAQSSLVINTVVEVTNDSDVTKNGVYLWNGTTLTKSNNDVLGQAKASIRADIKAINQAVFDSKTINKLDPNMLLNGYEIYGDGTLRTESDSVVSNFIDVCNKDFVTISGLQANPSIDRYYRFVDDNSKLINFGNITTSDVTLSVPKNATWLQITLKQRNSSPLDLSKAQVELSNNKSTYAAFIQGDIIGLHGTHIKQNPMLFDYLSIGKNLFDKSKAIPGYEVYGDGSLSAYPNAVASDYIIVNGLSQITLSGLQNNTEFNRYYAFYDANKSFIVNGYFAGNTVSITVPSNAKYFRFSLLQRTATAYNGGNTVQVESGSTATNYEAYKQGINSINGIEIVKPLASTISNSAWADKNFILFGDSITETSNVAAGDYTSLTLRSNWFIYAHQMLQVKDFRNFAKNGASYREYNGQETWQKISHQVATAISTGFTPDIVVIACGTNDGLTKLGDYDTAMGKAINALDMSITADAMRKNLYEINKAYPNAKLFSCLPLQRADDETSTRQPLYDLIRKMSSRYGFTVIDCHNESGIVKDFEIWQQQGRDLYDGLHPATSGQIKQAKLIAANIKANYQD